MKMDAMIDKMVYLKTHFKAILIVVLLILGIVVGVILVQRPQIFQSKASEEIYNTIEVTDDEGNQICTGNECEVKNPNSPIKFRIDVGGIEEQANRE